LQKTIISEFTLEGYFFRLGVLASRLAYRILVRNLQPQSDGFADVRQCSLSCPSLAPTARECRTIHSVPFIGFIQQNLASHVDEAIYRNLRKMAIEQ
jgi:hypothetical protein